MSAHLRFRNHDETHEPSSSDDEYDDNEKRLLDKFRNKKREESESETEVLGVGSENDSDDGSDNDNQSDIALSDVEGQEPDDNLPDVRAWGKEKKKYYGTDYVDQDYGGFQEKDAHAAEIEEEEVKRLQSQLMQQLDDNDFSLDIIFKKKDKEEVKEPSEDLIKTDLSKLTNKQKLQILQKEAPEFFALVDDFKAKMTIAKDFLQPIMQKYKSGSIENCKAVEFVQIFYQLILNYATNIYMYLLLKASNELKNHPVIRRLYQYRQLISKMEPVFDEIIKPQIDILLDENTEQEAAEKASPSSNLKKKKILKILTTLDNSQQSKKTKRKPDSNQQNKKIKLDMVIEKAKAKKHILESEDSDIEADLEVDTGDQSEKDIDDKIKEDAQESEGIGKRAITYQIAKNKGLTPHRKKEFRNPRVKHKIKFRKALIRRKGAVREPRKELTRYSGEISGIKASVSKSIKIKS